MSSSFFPDPMSPLMFFISSFHDYIMMLMLMVLSVVIYIFMMIVCLPSFGRFFKSSEMLEGIWTIVPCFVLMMLAAPSLMTLYLSEEVVSPSTSIKIIGHQWYWSYEYEGVNNMSYDSYMIPSSSLKEGDYRLLEVDNSVFLPYSMEVRLIVTSDDVIHSWCIPSMGMKMDAVPGRLNQFYMTPSKYGVMYGQCSEICGPFHSFMPIKIEVVDFKNFLKILN